MVISPRWFPGLSTSRGRGLSLSKVSGETKSIQFAFSPGQFLISLGKELVAQGHSLSFSLGELCVTKVHFRGPLGGRATICW